MNYKIYLNKPVKVTAVFSVSYNRASQLCFNVAKYYKTLGEMKLTDLTGIARRNQEQLSSVGVFTPLPFCSDQSIYAQVQHLIFEALAELKEIVMHCYELVLIKNNQMP
jgi:hypothetical protein